jgi:hypothetical protein
MTPKQGQARRPKQLSDKDRIDAAMRHLFDVAQVDDAQLRDGAAEVVYSALLMGRELHKGRQETVAANPFESRPPGSVPSGYWRLLRRCRSAARVLPKAYMRILKKAREELLERMEDAARITSPRDTTPRAERKDDGRDTAVGAGGRPSKCAEAHVDAAREAYAECRDREETYRRVRRETGAPIRTQRDWYNRRGSQHERAFADACGWELGE